MNEALPSEIGIGVATEVTLVDRWMLPEKATVLACLTLHENIVLNRLEMGKGQIVSKSDLALSLYGEGASRESNTIEVFIGRLRRKMASRTSVRITTVRGRGYRLEK